MVQPPPVNRHKSVGGLARIRRAFGYSLAGLRTAIAREHAFRQELALAAVLIPVALFLPASPPGKAALVASVLLVLVVELLNSAVESVVDLVSPGDHALAARAKDLGSAAVFVSLVNLAATWLLVLF
ncbi:MAG: diacylglycerol kinase [Burkholderiales bacterium]